MMERVSVAIDGPAAAGKSTVAKLIARKLGYTYVDTGAMYRAFTYHVLKMGLDPLSEKESCSAIPHVRIDLKSDGTVLCNDEDVTRAIRQSEVSANVSYIASYKAIRLALVEEQRAIAAKNDVVMDGRDIGTYVLPFAKVKIFLVASIEERARRRYVENTEKGLGGTLQEIIADVKKRDRIDSSRAFAPLRPAKDAVRIDTTELSIPEVVEKILAVMKEKAVI